MSEAALIPETQMQTLVLASFQRLESEGTLAKLVDDQLKDTIKRLVQSSLSEYSDFGKLLKKQVEAQAMVNFDTLQLPTYNNLVMQAIERIYLESAQQAGLELVMERVRELFGADQPKTVKLSAILKMMRKDHHGEEWEDHKMTLHVDDREHIIFIAMDSDERKDRYRCQYNLTVSRDKATGTMKVTGVDVRDTNGDRMVGIHLGRDFNGMARILTSAFMQGREFELDADDDSEELYFGRD